MIPTHTTPPTRQRGAIFLVMLVILIMGLSMALVSALSKVTLQTARNEASADLLAQAKEVVIGYAVNNSSRPGDLPNQDRLATSSEPNNGNYDGDQDGCPGLTGCLGRLPWRTLGMSISSPSQNDPIGQMPWYAVSANMVDPTNVVMNSEILNLLPPSSCPPAPAAQCLKHNWLTVRDMNGNILSNRVAFVIIIPGPPINGQSRPDSPNLGGANQYLESITVPSTCTAPCVPGTYSNADGDDDFIMGDEHRWIADPANSGQQIEDPNYHFNDKLIYVTIDDLMPLIEKRIAREVKTCLDTYSASSGKYPWPAPVTDVTTYQSVSGTYFGRIPAQPTINNNPTSDPNVIALLNAMSALDGAVQACLANGSLPSNETALISAGATLVSAATNAANSQPTAPPVSSTATNYAITAGNKAQSILFPSRCSRIGSGTSTTVQTNLANAYAALGSLNVPEDPSMQPSWPTSPTSCFSAGTYWNDWKNLVFYQIASGYQPNGSLSCVPGSTCLTINGNGNYHAAVMVAGKMLAGQNPRNQTASPPGSYLEGINPHNSTAPAVTFETYKPTDAQYSTINDLVLCLDGKNYCK